MEINCLAQLKRALQVGAEFQTIQHQKPELVGLIRRVKKVQTNAVYTVIPSQPDHKYSICNDGDGCRMDFNRASHYEFGKTIKWYKKPIGADGNYLVMEFQLLKNAS